MESIKDQYFEGERPLYVRRNGLRLENVKIGPGESSLKEGADIEAVNCEFNGKYPFWECDGFTIRNCIFREGTRAAVEKTFTVVNSLDDPRCATADRLGVLPPKVETGYIVDGRTDFLPKATRQAIDFLNARKEAGKGFFLMVEGARIDKACHANQYESAVRELLDFDQAIAEAIKYADEDGNTLVVISADHETGGLVIWGGDPEEGDMEGVYVSGSHTAIPVPIFSYGPHAQDFMGVQGNEQVAQKILKLFSR